jgi:uncharacterized protein
MDQSFGWEGMPGEAILRMPEGEIVAGLVTLHGASNGRARQALFDQIGQCLTPLGIAVLSYERRAVDRGDTPLHVQAADAVEAVRVLRSSLRRRVGVFGFSQGAWAAALAAADDAASFLMVLGCSGVTPAEQMRFYTDELLRRRGFGPRERDANREVRMRLEEYLQAAETDPTDRQALSDALRAASREPWFPSSYLPSTPPPEGASWDDMDFDPAPSFANVRQPVLAMWGADEECVPREVSRERWQASGADVTVVDLPGCGHWPVVGSGAPDYSGWESDELAHSFASTMVTWLRQVSVAAPPPPRQ